MPKKNITKPLNGPICCRSDGRHAIKFTIYTWNYIVIKTVFTEVLKVEQAHLNQNAQTRYIHVLVRLKLLADVRHE